MLLLKGEKKIKKKERKEKTHTKKVYYIIVGISVIFVNTTGTIILHLPCTFFKKQKKLFLKGIEISVSHV